MTIKEEKKERECDSLLVSYVSINCIRFTGIISAQSTPTNNGVQSIYFAEEGQGVLCWFAGKEKHLIFIRCLV